MLAIHCYTKSFQLLQQMLPWHGLSVCHTCAV